MSAVQATMPDTCIFSRTYRRAYVSSLQGALMGYTNLGIVDTERDTLLRVLPVRLRQGLYNRQVAVDERDGKVYITDCDDKGTTPDTMWVVDCATDSVSKKFECVHAGRPRQCIRWVPWSNRIYFINIFPDATHLSSLVVVDCNTDSVIVPQMLLSDQYLYDIQLDPIHQRIFVTGGDTNTVCVLRDVEGGVAEEPTQTPEGLCPKPAATVMRSLPSGAAAFDAMGRRVASPKPGVYFLREAQAQVQAQAVRKVIIQR